jgi:hypothetical protein
MFSVFNKLYKSIPNLPNFVLRLKAQRIKMEIKYHFDSRFLKEIIRERLIINSSRWDYKAVRNYCSILGEGNLSRTVLCKHLSSALVNNFEKILLYMLNNMENFRDYTRYGITEIWMPRFMLRMLQLAMCPKLEPQIRVSDLIHVIFDVEENVKFMKYNYTLPKNTIGYIPDYAKIHQVLDKDGNPIVAETPTEEEYITALIELSILSKTAFRDCSIEVGAYADMIEYNNVDFLSCIKTGPYNLFDDKLNVLSTESLTRENLLTNITLGIYVNNFGELPKELFHCVAIPLDTGQVREELRLYIESEFRTSTVTGDNVTGGKSIRTRIEPENIDEMQDNARPKNSRSKVKR